MSFTHIPRKLCKVTNSHYCQQHHEMKSFSDITARHLEEVSFLKLLEHTSLQLNKLQEIYKKYPQH